jgi:hypothetical protein
MVVFEEGDIAQCKMKIFSAMFLHQQRKKYWENK